MLALSALLLLTLTMTAQTQPAGQSAPLSAKQATSGKTASQKAHARRHVAHHPARRTKTKEPVVVAPPAPPAPVPPADQVAQAAKIDFSRGTLRINADNSSLVQILNQVSHETGIVIDGLSHDERVYGQYGPGPVASTLTALLNGAGYNYIIIGGGDGQPPSKLLLTASGNMPSTVAPAPVPATASAPAEPTAPANPSEVPHPKTPQEIFNELRRMRPPPQ